MPRNTPGGLPQDPVILGVPALANQAESDKSMFQLCTYPRKKMKKSSRNCIKASESETFILSSPVAYKMHETDTANNGYTSQPPHTSMDAATVSNTEMFGSMNGAASVAIMTGGDGGYAGGGF